MPPNTETQTQTFSVRNGLTQDEIRERVKSGDALFIFEDKIYKVNRFMNKHPGGELAIRHVLGKDVTDEIRSMHPPRVYERMIKHYCIGDYIRDPKLDPTATTTAAAKATRHHDDAMQIGWQGSMSVEAFDAKIDELYAKHADDQETDRKDQKDLTILEIRQAYRRLEQEFIDRGLFKCNHWRYAKECCRYVTFIYLSLWLALRGYDTWHFLLSAVFMGCFWHQLVFTAHDAGHNEITGRVEIDHLIGVMIANFIGGLSIGWWKKNHNVHHIVTNHPEHDPDIQHMPFFAITTRFFNNIYSTYYNRVLEFDAPARFFLKYQHHLYYLVLSFGRFNLHRLSFLYLFLDKEVRNRKLELTGIAVFFVWFSYLLSYLPSWSMVFAYIMISYIVTSPLHVQITLSHFGMSTADLGPDESFPAKQLRTTMDVDCPEWFDWFHGGLQYQAVHHLFPRLPRHNLRQCVPLVRKFCKETGLHYYMYNFSTGNGVVLGALKSVADQVHLMNDVAKYNAGVWSGDKLQQETTH
ncbi:fatty acid desaturase-domain-containing protein [Zychaea mexicana]|uniref:fatty acid desaturase-domain-containing protein n=1 Tax=Zychaea mexicana TaxID=64656 RepID=UPI0022FDC001|nr:fatty acid desaturase-domain-containing protein [Zychaea mexicana]KAI9490093.1 fatty acid desaturase-domain-containing protein [Zychaea mexicana]